jgi:hypothetical protein
MTESIISDWKAGRFRTVYWLQGEEEFFIDQLVDHAEQVTGIDGERFFGAGPQMLLVFEAIREEVVECSRFGGCGGRRCRQSSGCGHVGALERRRCGCGREAWLCR